MRKLQLADICGYFPYNIEFSIKEILGVKTVLAGPFTQGIEYNNRMVSISWIYRNIDNGIKPILRPMSDLCKPIKVEGYNEGKEFIPMIEFCKKTEAFKNNYSNVEPTYKLHEPIKFNSQVFAQCEIIPEKSDSGVYKYFPLYKMNGVNLQEIDLLNQWHFDYRGLIEEGLAVDINKINKEQ